MAMRKVHGVGPVCVQRTGCALVGRAHNLRHRVLKQMKGQAPHTVRRPDSFLSMDNGSEAALLFGGTWPIYMDKRA